MGNNKLHIDTASRYGSPFVPLFLLDRSIESGGRADLEFAVQIICANVANAHNVVVMSSQSGRKSNLQIGSLQIDVHEPALPLSHAVVISMKERHLRQKLVWKSLENLLLLLEIRTQLRVNDLI